MSPQSRSFLKLSYCVATWQIRLALILLLKTEHAGYCLLDCALLLEKHKQTSKQKKKTKKTKQVTVGLKNWKVAFVEFHFLKKSFRISLFLNFLFLRPTVNCFFCLFARLYFSSNKSATKNGKGAKIWECHDSCKSQIQTTADWRLGNYPKVWTGNLLEST